MTKHTQNLRDKDLPEFTLTPEQEQAVREGLKEYQEGKTKTIDPHDFNQIFS